MTRAATCTLRRRFATSGCQKKVGESSRSSGWRGAVESAPSRVSRVHPAGCVEDGEGEQEYPERLHTGAGREVAPVVALDGLVVPPGDDHAAADPLAHDLHARGQVEAEQARPRGSADA